MGTRYDLIAAMALIDTLEKWKRGPGDDGPGTPCCAVVATNRIAWESTANKSMRNALHGALPERYQLDSRFHGWDIGCFNDDRATSHADIMALFDRAIASVSP